MQLSTQQIELFRETVWSHYHAHARSMPWREHPTPYYVLVSELMLQQTQVSRVLPKFETFIARFPDFKTLAGATLADVLALWSGLGYNRRAKFLHQAAQVIIGEHQGVMPDTIKELVRLPGVGRNTTGAILAYAFNQPVAFIETNIRTVYFYHFFAEQEQVSDETVRAIVAQTLDRENPREWYWALMDYGTFLKQTVGNNIAQSRHYTKQSTFKGSRRQIRGAVLKALLGQSLSPVALQKMLPDTRTAAVLGDLQKEGFITEKNGLLRLTDNPKLP